MSVSGWSLGTVSKRFAITLESVSESVSLCFMSDLIDCCKETEVSKWEAANQCGCIPCSCCNYDIDNAEELVFNKSHSFQSFLRFMIGRRAGWQEKLENFVGLYNSESKSKIHTWYKLALVFWNNFLLNKTKKLCCFYSHCFRRKNCCILFSS